MKKLAALLAALVLLLSMTASAEFIWNEPAAIPSFVCFTEETFTLNEKFEGVEYAEYAFSGTTDHLDLVQEYLALLLEEYDYQVIAYEDNVDSFADRICYLDGSELAVNQFARTNDAHAANIQIQLFRYHGTEDLDVIFRLGAGLVFEE